MRLFPPQVAQRVLSAVLMGFALGAIEAALVGAASAELFLSVQEFLRYALLSCCTAISVVLLLNRLGVLLMAALPRDLERRAWAAAAGVAALAWPLIGRAFWLLSAGRRLHGLPARGVLVAVLAAVGALLAGWLARRLILLRFSGHRRLQLGALWALLLCAALALALDTHLLRRLYPAFHVSLSVFACLAAASASPFLRLPLTASRRLSSLALLGVLAGCAGPLLLRRAAAAPNLSFAIEQSAPLSGKALALMRPRQKAAPASALATAALQPPALMAAGAQALPAHTGIDLRGRDLLLITIDALRADRLKAYGGRAGVTPVLDSLATESVVFTRAYTQTPHTSYALGSLMTGKYLRPVLSLPNAPREHATLARVLRRYGYRTAAFYPPAVFFVDEGRFSALAEDHFGFEYVKEMFASASDRVTQLEQYLAQADPKHSILAWVHLFEPHEPYDAHPEYGLGDEPEQRYDAEIRAADAAVEQLLRVFRARRPNATVIVSSDHGEEFADHGGYHHGTTLFEEQVRVPLLWSSPGQARARVVDAPVELVDLVPTVLAALGIPRDVRMLGDDLSGVLAGAAPSASLRAFASIEAQQMWTNGRWKAVCDSDDARCRLFDLELDPAERRDASAEQPAILTRLRGELNLLIASLPNVEAMAMSDSHGGWPEALARARLGDASVGPQLLPLLGDERAEVRAEAARAVGTLGLREAQSLLRTLRTQDSEDEVRAEAALAALWLGDEQATAQVQQVFAAARAGGASQLDLTRRAALALGRVDLEHSRDVLLSLLADRSAGEAERLRALQVLELRRDKRSVRAVIELMEGDVRLRPEAARALGVLGGRQAQDALARALAAERYPEARAAEVEALIALGDRRAKPLLLRMLGTQTSVPHGLAAWQTLGGPFRGQRGLLFDLEPQSGQAQAPGEMPSGTADARTLLQGTWDCSAGEPGCRPGADATGGRPARIAVRPGVSPRVASRFVVELSVQGTQESIEVNGERFILRPGDVTLGMALPRERARTIELSGSSGVRVRRFAIVPREADIAPPAPEPYDAGPGDDDSDP